MRTVRKNILPSGPDPGSGRLTTGLQALAALCVLSMALMLTWHPLEDLDVWFHHRAGNDLLADGPLPALNSYSFTEPRHPWLNHEWLFQFLVAKTGPQGLPAGFAAAGWNTLRIALVSALMLLLLGGDGGLRRLRGGGSAAGAVAAGAALMAALALLWPRLLLRPELVSFPALVLLVRWTEAWQNGLARDGNRTLHTRRLLDPRTAGGRVFWLIVAWAQCHGFSSVAPLVVAIGLLGSHPNRNGWRGAALGALASLLALMLTPNGWQGLTFPLRALGQFGGEGADLRRTVAELTPLLRSPGMFSATIPVFWASLAAGLVLAVTGWRRIGTLRLLLWAGTATAAFATQRALGPYAVAFALLALRWSPPVPVSTRARPFAIAGAALLVAATGWWGAAVRNDSFYLSEGVARRFGSGLATAQYPLDAARQLAAGAPVRVFANLGASGLLLGTTRAELYIDGRTEAYSAALWREYAQIRAGGDNALALLDARHVEAVCLAGPAGAFAGLLRDLVASHRWQVEAADGGGVLLRRDRLTPGPEAAPRQETAKLSALAAAARDQEQEAAAAGLSAARAADALVAAAALHRLGGDTAAALSCLQRATARAPRHALAWHNLGNLQLADGQFEAALGSFERASRANRRLAPPRLNAGVCLMRLGRAAEAVGRFEQAAGLDGDSVEPWANLAVARQAAGDAKGALAAVQRALALSPADARLSSLRDALRRAGTAQ